MKNYFFILLAMTALLASCKNDAGSSGAEIKLPDHPVTEDQAHITQEYIDSLNTARQQNLIDLRRDLGFNCVDIVPGKYVSLKIKVHPDGRYDDVEVLDDPELDLEPIKTCVNTYFEERDLNFGKLMDLPSSGKTINKHPHVYTLLIY